MSHFWKSNWPNILFGTIFAIVAIVDYGLRANIGDLLIWLFISTFNFILIICTQQGEKIENQEKIIENQEKILTKLDNLNFTAEFKK